MNNCIFCNISTHKMPAKIIYEDDVLTAFHDIHPQAPVHVLLIPKKHITTISEIEEKDLLLIGKLIFTAEILARELNISKKGYRLVFNNGRDGGQQVYHIHLHLLGGRPLHWPPG